MPFALFSRSRLVLLCGLLATTPLEFAFAQARDAVSIDAQDPAAAAVAEHLKQIMAGRLPPDAAKPGQRNVLVTLDGVHGEITVKLEAGTVVLARKVNPATMQGEPYAVAMAAAELIDVARTSQPMAPLAQVAPTLTPPSQPTKPRWGFGALLGISGGGAPGHEARLLSPLLDLQAVYRLGPQTPWQATWGLSLVPGGRDEQEVLYTRREASVHLGLGRSARRFWTSAALVSGLALVDAKLVGGGAQAKDTEWFGGARAATWLTIAGGWAVGVWGEAIWIPSPLVYRRANIPIYTEAHTWLRVGVGIGWQFGLGSAK